MPARMPNARLRRLMFTICREVGQPPFSPAIDAGGAMASREAPQLVPAARLERSCLAAGAPFDARADVAFMPRAPMPSRRVFYGICRLSPGPS